jgi:hypothetical protein
MPNTLSTMRKLDAAIPGLPKGELGNNWRKKNEKE